MKLNQSQIKIQEAIVLRLYEGCTIEQARGKEVLLNWCVVYNWQELVESKWLASKSWDNYHYVIWPWYASTCKNSDIIWLPPTLPRVLSALGDRYLYGGWSINTYRDPKMKSSRDTVICYRKLLNDDKSDATLRDQSEDTQKAIWKLLGVE